MNIKINFFNNQNISYQNPLRKKTPITISHPKNVDFEILENFLINNSLESKITQKKHF